MKVELNLTTPPDQCSYLPDRESQTEFDMVSEMSAMEYQERLLAGWRHFGRHVFRPACSACKECKSLRIPVRKFKPNRSQKRNQKLNREQVQLVITKPFLSDDVIDLHDRFHLERAQKRGWDFKEPNDRFNYTIGFLDNPFEIEQWNYFLEGKLVGVGYVDALECGLSAIYFFHDTDYSKLGLGIWNVLRLIQECKKRKLPHLYLGYYVKGCQSLEYKASFQPTEVLTASGNWENFAG